MVSVLEPPSSTWLTTQLAYTGLTSQLATSSVAYVEIDNVVSGSAFSFLSWYRRVAVEDALKRVDLNNKYDEIAQYDSLPDYMFEHSKPEVKRLMKKYSI